MTTEQEGSKIQPDQAFVQRAKERINRMNSVAGEVTKELGLPAEAKYSVLTALHGNGNVPQGGERSETPHRQPTEAVSEHQQKAPGKNEQ